MKEIPLGNGLNAKVDDEDYEWLSRYTDPENVPDTNGGSLRSRSTDSEQPMFDFGPRMQFLCVKLGKTWLKQPLFVPDTFNSPKGY